MTEQAAISRDGAWLVLRVKARPGAKADRIRGLAGGLVQIDVAAAPENGKATERMLVFLADSFGVPRRDVNLVSGAHARWKRVRIKGATRLPEGLVAEGLVAEGLVVEGLMQGRGSELRQPGAANTEAQRR